MTLSNSASTLTNQMFDRFNHREPLYERHACAESLGAADALFGYAGSSGIGPLPITIRMASRNGRTWTRCLASIPRLKIALKATMHCRQPFMAQLIV
jgi:hypothetical protein